MDFLQQRSISAIKRELENIRDSYHHYWDLLAEMLQNSRDAIIRARQEGNSGPFFIRIKIDSAHRLIEVFDNGIGIQSEMIQEILAPGGGDKNNRPSEVGEKGVGLTYAVFSGDLFEIESGTSSGTHFRGIIKNARSWLDGNGNGADGLPEYRDDSHEQGYVVKSNNHEIEGSIYPVNSFTRISVSSIPPLDAENDIFSMSPDQLKFIISTKTAVGVTKKLFMHGWQSEFDTFFDYSLGNGYGRSIIKLDAGFPIVHSYVTRSLRLEDVLQAFVTRDEGAKRRFLNQSAVWALDEQGEGEDRIRVYGVMMPGNGVFSQISKGVLRLADATASEDDLSLDIFRSGIFVATKGMPTGVEIPPGPGGSHTTFYQRCLFIVESDSIRFDQGRKSMHWRTKTKLQAAVTRLFKKLEVLATYQSDERPRQNDSVEQEETKAAREARIRSEWDRYAGLVTLNGALIPYAKVPDGQEAAVAAIFHELLGARYWSRYVPLHTGYAAQYDLHALYQKENGEEPERLLIEFKYTLESIIADLVQQRKHLDDVHLLVVWDANEQMLRDSNFDLNRAIDPAYEGVTHIISIPQFYGLSPIPVIILKTVFDHI